MKNIYTSSEGGRATLTGQQVLEAASEYPSMLVRFCYDSAEILSGVYGELRTAEGIRLAELPGVDKPRRIEHGWCVKQDGTIIDAVFAEELKSDPELDPTAIRITYIELGFLGINRSGRPGALREEVRRRARQARPPLVSARRRWEFAERERDKFRSWLEATGHVKPLPATYN